MNRGLITPQRVLVAVVLLMLISSLLPVRGADKIGMVPAWLVRTLVEPVARPLTYMAAEVRSAPGLPSPANPADPDFAANYDAMKQYIAALEQEREELIQQLSDLAMVPLETRRAVTFVPARVSVGPRDRLDPVITISRGKNHGVERDMIVASGHNLVGIVIDATASSATVRLITSPHVGVAVTIMPQLAPPGTPGLPVKLRHDRTHSRSALLADAKKDGPVAKGDLAYLRDPTWPREAAGYVVGQVTDITNDPADPILRRIVVIEPRVDLAHLTQVYVVVPKE